MSGYENKNLQYHQQPNISINKRSSKYWLVPLNWMIENDTAFYFNNTNYKYHIDSFYVT
jgi:hypothetical protein